MRGARLFLVATATLLGSACGDTEPGGSAAAALKGAPPDLSDAVTRVAFCADPDREAIGRPGRVCGVLDGLCVSGEMSADQCCEAVPLPKGVACGAQSACDGAGKCVAGLGDDRDGDGVLDEEDTLIGANDWLRTPLSEVVIRPVGEHVELHHDGRRWARLALPVDLSRVTFDVDRDLGVVTVQSPYATEYFVPHEGAYCGAKDGAPGAGKCEEVADARYQCPGQGPGWSCEAAGEAEGEDGFLLSTDLTLTLLWTESPFPFDRPERCEPNCVEPIPGLLPTPDPCGDADGDGDPDDDADGAIDEYGHRSCDDGLWCSNDSCVAGECVHREARAEAPGRRAFCDDGMGCSADFCPTVEVPEADGVNAWQDEDGCFHRAQHWLCDDGAACSQDFCGPGGEPEDGVEVVANPRRPGCFHHLVDTFCSEEFDGCSCNGPEECNPFAYETRPEREEMMGCVPAGPADLPCEDGEDLCTIETCCEPFDSSCRDHRRLMEGDPELAALDGTVSSCSPEVLSVLSRIPKELIPWGSEPPGVMVGPNTLCATGDARNVIPRGRQCEGPCVTDTTCDHHTGACFWTNLPAGPSDECGGQVHAWAYWEGDHTIVDKPTCAAWQCDGGGSCVPSVDSAGDCSNGEFCDGEEVCDLGRLVDGGDWHISSKLEQPAEWGSIGCVPAERPACDDRIGCTSDVCDEENDRCAHQPNPGFCAAENGEVLNLCAPTWSCNPDADCVPGEWDCGDRSGCERIVERNPCDDGNWCTRDTCEVDDLGYTCGSSTVPGCGELVPDYPIDAPRFPLPPLDL